MPVKSIYLAGNLGFSESGRDFMYDKLMPAIKRAGYDVLDPWKYGEQLINPILELPDCHPKKAGRFRRANIIIGAQNEKLIRHSDGVIAVLDGPDVDSGTAAEIGFAYGIKKKTIGYRSDFRLSSENIAAKINLQVEYFIERNGGKIVRSLGELEKTLETFDFTIHR